MADLTSSGTTHKPNLSNTKRREVIVQHEALGALRGIQQLDALLVILGAERSGHHGLGFAAREQRGSVGAGKHADFALDVADLVELAPVGTPAVLQHLVAEDALLEHVEELFGFRL